MGPPYKLTHNIRIKLDQKYGHQGQISDFFNTYLPLVAKICNAEYYFLYACTQAGQFDVYISQIYVFFGFLNMFV